MRIAGIHHAQVMVPRDAEAQARAFYCGVLGLVEIEKPEVLRGRGGFWLAVGTQQVHIGLEDGIDRSRTRAHVAYQVDDLAVWREKLVQAGFTPLDGDPIPGYARMELRDPFGNRIELLQAL